MTPIVSVIIPCFDSGKYLLEAISSVEQYPVKDDYEIIVVNDGSSDQETLTLLESLYNRGYTILHQLNKGPAAARNSGVNVSKGSYLLFLDSDNKVRSEYIEIGIKILEENGSVGVVYGRPEFFGALSKRVFYPKAFDIYSLLKENYIDMCAIVRKEAWSSVDGLDEERLLIGHEDWEFWVRLASRGWQFQFVDKVLYDYRIREDSLITRVRPAETSKYVFERNAEFIYKCYRFLYKQFVAYQYDKRQPFRSFVKYLFYKVRGERG